MGIGVFYIGLIGVGVFGDWKGALVQIVRRGFGVDSTRGGIIFLASLHKFLFDCINFFVLSLKLSLSTLVMISLHVSFCL